MLAEWQSRFDKLPAGARIGIAWQGGELAKDRQRRCIETVQLNTLLEVPRVQWINLQHGIPTEIDSRIHDWPEFDLRDDLENLAARIAACDLVISVGNAAMHLAGALGRSDLVPATSDRRLEMGNGAATDAVVCECSPLWQDITGDWKPLLNSLAEVLPKWIASHTAKTSSEKHSEQQSLTQASTALINGHAPLAAPHWQMQRATRKQDLLS